MKLFKRIFSFSVMLVLGVLFLTSCKLNGDAKNVKIDMSARVYVSQSYDLIAKDDKGEIVTDATWSVSEGEEFAVIQDGKLVPIKAGIFTLTVTNGKETDSKKISAVNPIYWDIKYNLNGGKVTNPESYNIEINGVKIKNETSFGLDNSILQTQTNINKENILIFHTHTCESYTPTEKYNYASSGNYRTTDLGYSVARVGDELELQLKSYGKQVIQEKKKLHLW